MSTVWCISIYLPSGLQYDSQVLDLLVSLHNHSSSLVTPVVEYPWNHHTVISSQSGTWLDKIWVCKWLITGSDPMDTRSFRFFFLSEFFMTRNRTRSSWTGNRKCCMWISKSKEDNEQVCSRFLVYMWCKGWKMWRLSKQTRQRFPFIINMDGVATHTFCLYRIDSTISLNLSLFSSGQVSSHRGV